MFFDELDGQLINISQLITVHYILSGVKRNGRSYIDCTFTKLDDFLDPVKEYYLFISDYCFQSKYGCAYFSKARKEMVYLSLNNDVAKDIFRDANEESNENSINIATYNSSGE
ncbi:hypothetical protein [Psychromonas sp. KJ10-2]|uniref:hypothetical protein n=1 Tax=Psychromonas sp. KJ10-2 TaxID=3391822 RepID=UPI0039B48E33